MPIYHGKDGALYLRAPSGDLNAPTTPSTATGTRVGQVTEWTIRVSQDIHDTSAFGDEFRTFFGGLRSWDATVNVILDPTAAVEHDEMLEAILPDDFGGSLASGGVIQMDLFVDAETAGSNKKVYYGAARLENVEVSTPVANLVTARFQFRGNGRLKFTATAS